MNKIMRKIKEFNQRIAYSCDKRYLRTYLDLLWCWLRYGFTPNEYFAWHIFDFSATKRNAFLTTRRMKSMWRKNPQEIQLIFGDKSRFHAEYAKFTKREFIDTTRDTYENFVKFVKKHQKVFIKPLWLCGGMGAQIYQYTTDEDIERIYNEMANASADKGMLAEELIVQHPKMNDVGPNSVNTIRITTYTHNGTPHIISCTLRMGVGDGCTDNLSAGGYSAAVDMDSGIVTTPCVQNERTISLRHPTTGTIVPGFQIPHWDKAKEIVLEAALHNTNAIYIGWDVAILENDVLLIEGNWFPGNRPVEIADRVGRYDKIRKINRGLIQ